MTITLKIDNPDIEEQLMQFVKQQKEITVEALKSFLNSFQTKEKFDFKKKDPRKHSRKREYIDEGNEDLSDVKLYSHIEDSAKYVYDLRRLSNRIDDLPSSLDKYIGIVQSDEMGYDYKNSRKGK